MPEVGLGKKYAKEGAREWLKSQLDLLLNKLSYICRTTVYFLKEAVYKIQNAC